MMAPKYFISFLLSFYFVYKIVFKIFNDRNIAINSCYFLLIGSYIYEYAIGIWPHVLNLLLILISCYLSLILIYQRKDKKSFLIAFLLGFIIFFNFGIRMDSILSGTPTLKTYFTYIRD